MIRGITFANQLTTSADFAHYINTFLAKNNGRTKGVEITHDDDNIYIGAGYFVTYGRYIAIEGTETVATDTVDAGTQYNRLVFTIDLSKVNTESEFEQGYWELLTSYDSYPKLTKEDLDDGGKIYQVAFCKFTKTVNGITNFARELKTVEVGQIFDEMSTEIDDERKEFDEMFSSYRADFIAYFDAQKAEIEKMISDLQDENFVTGEKLNDTLSDYATKEYVATAVAEQIGTALNGEY
jgi:hypothetical protein